MSYPELNQYISKRLSQGATREIITDELLPNGWSTADIDSAFSEIDAGQKMSFPKKVAPVVEPKPVMTDIRPITSMEATEKPASEMYTPGAIAPTGHSTALKVVVVVAVIILLAVGSTLSYSKFGTTKIEKLMAKVISATEKTSSISYKISIESDYKSSVPEKNNTIKFSIDGAVNGLDKANYSNKNTALISFKSEMMSFDASVEQRLINNTLYLSLKEIPSEIAMLTGIDLSYLIDEWLSVSLSDAGEFVAPVTGTNELDKASADKIIASVKKNSPFKVSRPKTEMINGTKTNKYSITVDSDKFAKTISEISEIQGTVYTRERIDEMKTEIEKFFSGTTEIWIGANNYLPYKISYKIDKVALSDSDSMSLSITIDLNDHNKVIVIDEPEESTDLKEVISDILSFSKTQDDIVMRLNEIETIASSVYDESNNTFNAVCGANKVKQDKEISASITDLKSGYPDMNIVCGKPATGNAKAWAISASIPDENFFWCVDSTGASRQISSQIKGTTTSCQTE